MRGVVDRGYVNSGDYGGIVRKAFWRFAGLPWVGGMF
jgi:hypothetical protein